MKKILIGFFLSLMIFGNSFANYEFREYYEGLAGEFTQTSYTTESDYRSLYEDFYFEYIGFEVQLIIETCTNDNSLEGTMANKFYYDDLIGFQYLENISYNDLIGYCGENVILSNNGLVDLVNNTASSAITTTTDLMSGPIGYVVYLTLGLSILGLIVFTVKKWF